jgi:DNA-binding MarR family transcriptional regulator
LERVATPLGEAAAVARLASAFRVPPQAVAELRDQKLDLGEIAVVLALAEAGRASPDAILALWANGRLNWGEIADRLKVDLRTLLRRLDTVRRDLGRSTR